MAMSAQQRSLLPAGPVIMGLSAALFGYFGFGMQPRAADGQLVLFMALLMWTLRASCACFALSAATWFFAPAAANLLFALSGVSGAGLLLVVAIMDMADTKYAAAIPPVLLLIFVAWNGYSSWSSLQALAALRRGAAGTHGAGPGT
jgi:hypothetical protein